MSKLVQNQIEANVPKAWSPTFKSTIKKGLNAEIWDQDGNRFLDYVGGYAVLNTGHVHPKVISKVIKQLDNFSHSCFAYAPHQNAIDVCTEINKRYPIESETKTFLKNDAHRQFYRSYSAPDAQAAHQTKHHHSTWCR